MTSAGHAFWGRTFAVLSPPARNADVYGVTTSSYDVSTTVYETRPGVSSPALRLSRNADPARCWSQASQTVWPATKAPGLVVPWLDGASPTRSSTFVAPPRNLM